MLVKVLSSAVEILSTVRNSISGKSGIVLCTEAMVQRRVAWTAFCLHQSSSDSTPKIALMGQYLEQVCQACPLEESRDAAAVVYQAFSFSA